MIDNALPGPNRFRHRQGQEGIALLLVMLVVVLVLIVVTELSLSARVDLQVSSNEIHDLPVQSAIHGALDVARHLLKTDGDENSHDSTHDKWGDPEKWIDLDFGEVKIKIDVVDESRKFNLYWLIKGTSTEKQRARDRLVSILDQMREETQHDLSPAESADLAAKITDYIKVRRAGKKKEYEGILLPPTRKNFLLNLTELLPFVGEFIFYDQISEEEEGGEGEKLPGLERFVTLWSDGKTNVNTAEFEVLQCYFQYHERDKAQRIIEAREALADPEQNPELKKPARPTLPATPGHPGGPGQKSEKFIGIKNLQDLVKAEAITNKDKEKLGAMLGTASQVFSVFITAKKKNILRRVRVLIRRDKSKLFTMFFEERKDKRIQFGEDTDDPFSDEDWLSETDPSDLLKGK